MSEHRPIPNVTDRGDERGPGKGIYTPPGGPPASNTLSREIYSMMGEDAIRTLMHDFYERLAQSPIAGLFPGDSGGRRIAADRSADFFVFLFGGPTLYQQRHGRPMMRARHMPFEIDEPGRVAWMDCYRAAVDASIARGEFPAEHAPGLMEFLEGFSSWMVNVAPEGHDAGPDVNLL